MDIKKVEELCKLHLDEDIKRDLEEIIRWADILKNVPDVEPLFTPFEGFSPLREDETVAWDFDDPVKVAPDKAGSFIRFLSPIGRKT